MSVCCCTMGRHGHCCQDTCAMCVTGNAAATVTTTNTIALHLDGAKIGAAVAEHVRRRPQGPQGLA